jgi:hypothetical protein
MYIFNVGLLLYTAGYIDLNRNIGYFYVQYMIFWGFFCLFDKWWVLFSFTKKKKKIKKNLL